MPSWNEAHKKKKENSSSLDMRSEIWGDNTVTPPIQTSSKLSASDFLKQGINRGTFSLPPEEAINAMKSGGVSLASTPSRLTDAGIINLGNELNRRNQGLMTFKELINNAKKDKESGIGTWQRIVNRIGDTSELLRWLQPYANEIDKVTDKIASKTISNIATKTGKTENEVVNEIISRGLQLGSKLDAKAQLLAQEREGFTKAGQLAGQTAEALGALLPSVAVGILTKNPNLAIGIMSGSAMGQKGQEVFNATGDLSKAYDAGATEAAKEYATERMFAGVAGLGKGFVPALVGKTLTTNARKAIQGFINTPAGQIAKYFANAGGEGVEELVSQGLETYVNRIYDPAAAKATWAEMLQAAKVGGLVSLILGVGNINTNVTAPVKNKPQGIDILGNREYNTSGGINNGYSNGIYERSGGGNNNPGLQSEGYVGRNNQGVDRGLRVLISPIPEGTGEVVPSEFGTNTVPKMVEAGTLNSAIAAEMTKPEHARVSDEQLINTARSVINQYTVDGMDSYLTQKMNGGQPLNSVETTAVNELIQEYSRTGTEADKAKSTNLVNLFTSTSSDMGRALRAIQLFQRNMPGGLVRLANTQLTAKGLPELTPQEVADMNALQEFINQADRLAALDPVARKAKIDKMSQSMSEQYKDYVNKVFKKKDLSEASDWFTMLTQKITSDKADVTTVDKFRAMQRINLLLNPKTQIRNFFGNFAHTGVEVLGNAAVEPWVDKLIATKTKQRTATFPQLAAGIKGVAKGASETMTAAQLGLLNKLGNKYTDSIPMPTKAFVGNNPVSKVGNALNTATSFALTFGDKIFSGGRIADIEAQLRKVNPDLTEDQIQKISQEVGMTATFQNDSWLSKKALKLREALGGGVISYSVMPFVKTPSNILSQVFNYSPAGLVMGIKRAVGVARKGTEATALDQRKAVDAISRGVVGSGLMGVGLALASLGIASGSSDDEKDKEYRKMNGISDNSIKIGNYWVDFSTLGPVPASINLGASVYNELIKADVDEKTALNIVQTILSAPIQDVTQDSLWQGVIDFASYVGEGDIEGALTNIIGDTATQMVPLQSFWRMVTSITDKYVRETSAQKELGWASNKILSQLPGVSKTLSIKYDEQGNPVEKYPMTNNAAERGLLAAFGPVTMSKDKSNDPVTKELSRLYNLTGDNVSLQQAPYTFTRDGEQMKLRGEDRSDYQRIMGTTAKQTIQSLISSQQYKNASTDKKVEMINTALSLGTEAAKIDYFKGSGNPYAPSSVYQFTTSAKNLGVSVGKSILAYKFESSATAKDASGKTVDGLKKERVWNYLDSLGLTREQKIWMMDQFGYSTKNL